MRISIAMATYNGEKYLQEQLDSYVAQSRLPDELVVSDDCSSDQTLDILKQFVVDAPFPVRIKRNQHNIGYAGNFSRAMELCSGDIVFLSDQDDVWFPEKLKTVEQVFNGPTRPWVVINDCEITDAKLRPTGLTQLGQVCSAGLSENSFVSGCCTAFRAKLKSIILPVPVGKCTHDSWIHRIAQTLDKRIIIGRSLQYYRRHGQNTSDSFLSLTTGVTSWNLFKCYAGQDSAKACQRRAKLLQVLARRVEDSIVNSVEGLDGATCLHDALLRITREYEAVNNRTKLLEGSRIIGPFQACKLWLQGDYQHFSGWKSFMKDLLRMLVNPIKERG